MVWGLAITLAVVTVKFMYHTGHCYCKFSITLALVAGRVRITCHWCGITLAAVQNMLHPETDTLHWSWQFAKQYAINFCYHHISQTWRHSFPIEISWQLVVCTLFSNILNLKKCLLSGKLCLLSRMYTCVLFYKKIKFEIHRRVNFC